MNEKNVLRFNVVTDMEKERINKRITAYAQAVCDKVTQEQGKKN